MSFNAQEEKLRVETENAAWDLPAEKLSERKVSGLRIGDESRLSWSKLIPLFMKSSSKSWITFGFVNKARTCHLYLSKDVTNNLLHDSLKL
jgi:hypothetical protein